jgi:Protein of unknown function (DUF2946)
MVASRWIRWLRCILLAGLCYSLVLQTLLAQAAGIGAATADTQFVLCHGNGDQSPGGDDDAFARCHFCWLPASGAALLPETGLAISAPFAFAAPAYFFFPPSIAILRPPPRGASRAPPYRA